MEAFHARQRSAEFRRFLDCIEAAVPAGQNEHLSLDNSGTHKISLIHRWLVRHPPLHVPFTPTGVSRLDLVAVLNEKFIYHSDVMLVPFCGLVPA